MSYTADAFEAARARLTRFTPRVDTLPAITPDIRRRPESNRPGPRPTEGVVRGPLLAATQALRTHQTTSVQLVEAAIAAIEKHAGRTHAIVVNLGESALTMARELDAEAEASRWRGPLHGIPFSVKDNIDVAGEPTRAGSLAYDRVADRDADVVAAMRAAGAIPIAKVATHEFALGVTTPQARHPLDERRIPGGSSGGSGISIATGMALASIGTDTRASIRVPSSLCGVVGYKPTFGSLPRGGVVWLSWTMDHVGILAGSVGDAAYVAGAILPDAGLLEACGASVAGMRVGVPESGFNGASEAVARVVREAIDRLRAEGASIVETSRPSDDDFDLSNAAGLIVSRGEALEYHRSLRTDLSLVWPETADQLRIAEHITLHEYLTAQRFRTELADNVLSEVHAQRLDALVMPTTLVTAPLVEDAAQHFTALSRNAIPWSFIGWPAVSVPCGYDEAGLPVGLQVVAPAGEDVQALQVANNVGDSSRRG